jgi:hypothetical protein
MMRLRIRASLHTLRGIRNLFEKKKVDHGEGSEKKQFETRIIFSQQCCEKKQNTRAEGCRA